MVRFGPPPVLCLVTAALMAASARGEAIYHAAGGKLGPGGPRPALLFGPEDLEAIASAAGGTHAGIAAAVREFADRNLDLVIPPYDSLTTPVEFQFYGTRSAPVAFAYRVTGDPAYRDAALDQLRSLVQFPQFGKGDPDEIDLPRSLTTVNLVFTYDWLHDELSPRLRRATLYRIARAAEEIRDDVVIHRRWWHDAYTQNHNQHAYLALYLAGVLLDGVHPDAAEWRALAHKNFDAVLGLRARQGDGSDHEGPSYTAYGLGSTVLYLAVSARVGDRATAPDPTWLGAVPEFLDATLEPAALVPLLFGDGNLLYFAGPQHILFYLDLWLDRDDGHRLGLHRARRMRDFLGSDAAAYGQGDAAYAYLFFDPERDRPAARAARIFAFDDLGLGVLKGAGDRGPYVALKCGVPGGWTAFELDHDADPAVGNLNIGHDDPDANHLSVRLDGNLVLTDTGRVGVAKLTAHHNTITVNGYGQVGEGFEGWDEEAVRNWDRGGELVVVREWGSGVLLGGEAVGAYPPESGLRQFLREVWVRSDGAIFGVDWIEVDRASEVTHWFQGLALEIRPDEDGADLVARCAEPAGEFEEPLCPDGEVAVYRLSWLAEGSEMGVDEVAALTGEATAGRLRITTRVERGMTVFPWYVTGGADPEREVGSEVVVRWEDDLDVVLEVDGEQIRFPWWPPAERHRPTGPVGDDPA